MPTRIFFFKFRFKFWWLIFGITAVYFTKAERGSWIKWWCFSTCFREVSSSNLGWVTISIAWGFPRFSSPFLANSWLSPYIRPGSDSHYFPFYSSSFSHLTYEFPTTSTDQWSNSFSMPFSMPRAYQYCSVTIDGMRTVCVATCCSCGTTWFRKSLDLVRVFVKHYLWWSALIWRRRIA